MRHFAMTVCAAVASASLACAFALGRSPDRALTGTIWDVHAQRFVTADEALARIAAAPVTLVGETHDNAEHHRIERRIVEAAIADGRRPTLAMEQLDAEWQSAIDAAQAAGASAPELLRAGHAGSGWNWRFYEPLVELAAARRLPLVAANLARARTRDIVRDGLAALGSGEPERLALDRTWNPARQRTQREAIVEGHCGEDGPIVDRLVDVQRARDAVMADRILAHAADAVVAILGRGHARRDVGVPLYLAAREPRLEVLSVALVEVDADAAMPRDYAEAAPGLFDLVWFTSREARDDPCAAMPHPRVRLQRSRGPVTAWR